MSAEIRAPDPVRAHMRGAGAAPARNRSFPQRARRPQRGGVRGRRALAVAATTLLAPAAGAAVLLGLGQSAGGASEGLTAIEGTVGLSGSARTGDLTPAKRRRAPSDRAQKDFARAPARAPAPQPRAPRTPAPKPKPVPQTGGAPVPVTEPAPAVVTSEPTSPEEDTGSGQGGGHGVGGGNGGS